MYPRLSKERTINYVLVGKITLIGVGILLLGLLIKSHIKPIISGPEIYSLSHENGTVTNKDVITLSGKALRAEKVWINHNLTDALYQESFSAKVALLPGENFIHIEAIDRFQNKIDTVITIHKPIKKNAP